MTLSNPGPAERRVAREANPVGPLVKVLLIQLFAIVAVTAVLTAIYALTRGDGDSETATATGVVRSATPPPPATSPPVETSTGPPSTGPPSTSAPATPSAKRTADPRVDVLNQSAPGGSANQLAKALRRAGWRIGRVDDFNGNVSTTTIYYPPGKKDAARALARDLPDLSPRMLPSFSTLSPTHLTVLLTG